MNPQKRSLIQPKDEGTVPLAKIRAAVEGVHVLPDDQGWTVRRLSGDRMSRHFVNQDEAKRFAQSLCQRDHVAVFIHDQPAAS